MRKAVPESLSRFEQEPKEIYNYSSEERDRYISRIFEQTKKKLQINEIRETKSYKLAEEFKTTPII